MLAGRKLLLADDSITIQKVVALTFADEGIEVLAVNNGAEAVELLDEFRPDIVLADVYMPKVTGLQVCDYIKRNEKLKHIPVILLVGSFEPFDEAEARRVGADDTLTKPFQSIRTLVEKVGVLLGREPAPEAPEQISHAVTTPPPAEAAGAAELDGAKTLDGTRTLDGSNTLDGAQTLEFPDREPHAPDEPLDTGKLELMTADTRPLSSEIHAHLQQPASQNQAGETVLEEQKMETHLSSDAGLDLSEGFGDAVLDLGDFDDDAPLMASDDVILDIDFDSPAPDRFYAASHENWQSAVAVEAPAPPAVATEENASTIQAEEVVEWEGEIRTTETAWSLAPVPEAATAPAVDQFSASAAPDVKEFAEPVPLVEAVEVQHPPAPVAETAAAPEPVTGQITLAQLSPEVIDAIARRAVEQLSEELVQEIAWEVVPQLAELLIKRKLEELK